jgi:cellulose synthase operon protein C
VLGLAPPLRVEHSPVSSTRCKIALALLCIPLLGFEWEGRLGRLQRELQEANPARRREVVRLLASYPAHAVREPLLASLSDPDAGVRAEAAEAVGRVRLDEAVPVLLDWLGDADADVRTGAAIALGRIGTARAVAPLVRLLGDTRPEVRKASVSALESIGGPEVTVPLLGRLDDPDPAVRVAAAEALGRLGDSQAAVPLVGRLRDDAPEVRRALYTALGQLETARAIPGLLPGLEDPVAEVRLAAIGALGQARAVEAVPLLAPLVHDADHRMARGALSALGAIGSDAAVDAIVAGLTRSDTRETATSVLVHLARSAPPAEGEPSPDAVRRLARALDRTTSDVHATALAEALLRIAPVVPTEAAAAALLRAQSSGRGNRRTVLRALGATGSPQALVPLLELLGSEDGQVLAGAVEALEGLFEKLPPDGRAADPLLTALGRTPAAALPRLVRLLGHVRAARAVPALTDLLGHRHAAVRLAAVEALGGIGDAAAAPALLPLLDDLDGQTRFEAAQALARTASVATANALLDRATGRAPKDRHATLVALGGALVRLRAQGALTPDTAQRVRMRLAPLLDSPDRPLAARAIDTLAEWGDPANAALLVRRSRSGPRALRRHALRSLGAVDSEVARAELRRVLGAPADASLAAAAAGALGEHGTAVDAPLLHEHARKGGWPVASAASFGLARLLRRGVEADVPVPALCALAGDTRDPYVRANVAVALSIMNGRCDGGPDPEAWLGPRHAPVVRAAAAHWLASQARAGHAPRAPRVLAQCAAEDPSPSVAGACSETALPSLGSRADVYAYAPDSSTLWTDRVVALHFADGTVWVAHTDLNGRLWLDGSAEGPLLLEDPLSTPLEP